MHVHCLIKIHHLLNLCYEQADGAYIRTCNYDGTFLSISDNGTWNCLPCTICPDGFRVSQPCRHNSDAVCERCPLETFVTETGDKCRPCTVCQPGQYIEKHCHGNQDRKCKACAQGYYSSRWNSFSCRRCKHCRQRESVIRRCNGKNNSICGECEKGSLLCSDKMDTPTTAVFAMLLIVGPGQYSKSDLSRKYRIICSPFKAMKEIHVYF